MQFEGSPVEDGADGRGSLFWRRREVTHVCANRRWHFLVNVAAASAFVTVGRRRRCYRLGGIDVNSTDFRPGCRFESDRVAFGPGGMVNEGCYFENREHIDIGARCFLGPQVMIITSSHLIGGPDKRAGTYSGQTVTIGDGCWLGARAMILPGVTIGEGCVIAAGAVVVRDCEPHGMYGGIPARKLKSL